MYKVKSNATTLGTIDQISKHQIVALKIKFLKPTFWCLDTQYFFHCKKYVIQRKYRQNVRFTCPNDGKDSNRSHFMNYK